MRFDIIIPTYNEEHRIGRTLDSYRRAIDGPDVRFMIAMDACTDGTRGIVREHQRLDSRVHLFEYPKLGKGGVILETLRKADGDLVAFVDADRATPPSELTRLGDIAAGVGMAVASRWHPSSILSTGRPMSRRMASKGFAVSVKLLFGLPYFDTQCGAKVLRQDVLRMVLPYLSSRDFVFDVDLLLVARALSVQVAEVPTVWIDQRGSRVTPVADGRRMGASLLRLWLHHLVLPIPAAGAAGAAPATATATPLRGQSAQLARGTVTDVAA